MKNILPTFGMTLAFLLGFGLNVQTAQALSFGPGTTFINAQTQSDCETKGGNFTRWYKEVYCTTTGKSSVRPTYETIMPVKESNNYVTRAQFLKAVVEASNNPQKACRKQFPYVDVDWSADYGNALQIASCSGLVKGHPGGSFKPNKEISYAAAAKIITKAFNTPMTLQANLVNPQWYDGYISTLKRVKANPRADIAPGDSLTQSEMEYMVNIFKESTMPKTSSTPSDYIGLNPEEAEALAAKNGVKFRVVVMDGKRLPTTRDYRPGRINATTREGAVVSYEVEGQPKTEVKEDNGELLPPTNPDETMAPNKGSKVSYSCDEGKNFTVSYNEHVSGDAIMALGDNQVIMSDSQEHQAYLLTRSISSSGEKYSSDERVFWDQGNTATVFENGRPIYTNCKTQENVSDNAETMMISVGPEEADCVGVGPMKCLVVDDKLWYDQIQGFNFEPGYQYDLKIKKTARAEPIPADASAFVYELVEVVSKVAVGDLNGKWMWDQTTRANGDVVTPIKADAFVINFDSVKSQVSGTTDCNNFSGSFDLKNGLSVGPLASTRKACFGEIQESIFTSDLSDVVGYKINGPKLTLTSSSGAKMDFVSLARPKLTY